LSAARTPIIVYGAGGFGREAAWLAEECLVDGRLCEVVCFVDDDPAVQGRALNGIRVLSLDEAHRQHADARVVMGVAYPQMRKMLVERVRALGFAFATLIHPRVERSRWVEIGEGSVICAGSVLTTNIRLGQHVHINPGCTVGHDAVLGDFCTLTPGVHVAGHVHIGEGVFVGTGASIINGTEENPLVIGQGVTIGAGACVIRSVPDGLTVVGVPARPIERS